MTSAKYFNRNPDDGRFIFKAKGGTEYMGGNAIEQREEDYRDAIDQYQGILGSHADAGYEVKRSDLTPKEFMAKVKAQADEQEESSTKSYTYAGFSIKGEEGGEVTLKMNGPIDDWFDGINCRAIMRLLDTFDEIGSIKASIASPGGYMQDAVMLYSYLRRMVMEDDIPVSMSAPGLIASAGSLLYLAGDPRIAYDETIAMFHRPLAGIMMYGHEDEIGDVADEVRGILTTMEGQLSNIMQGRMGYSEDKVNGMLEGKGTWLNSDELGRVATKLISEKAKNKGKKKKEKNQIDIAETLTEQQAQEVLNKEASTVKDVVDEEFHSMMREIRLRNVSETDFDTFFPMSAERSEAPAQ